MTSDSYRSKQDAMDAQYRTAYEDWVKGLSPAERQQLEDAGLDQPSLPKGGGGAFDEDAADSPLASQAPDLIDAIEPEVQPQESAAGGEQTWDIARRLLGELMGQPNAKLTLECLALVSGVSFLGDSMTDIARRCGVTRAAVSKRCVALANKLGLHPARAMRRLTARKAYANAQNKNRSGNEQFDRQS